MARTFQRRERLSGMSEINVTPLLDLAFSLLIIFMISAPLLEQSEQSIDLSLPQETARAQPAPDVSAVRIALDARSQLYWDGEQIDWSILDARLRNMANVDAASVLHVRADADLPYQKVVDLMDRIKASGLTRISLDTQGR